MANTIHHLSSHDQKRTSNFRGRNQNSGPFHGNSHGTYNECRAHQAHSYFQIVSLYYRLKITL